MLHSQHQDGHRQQVPPMSIGLQCSCFLVDHFPDIKLCQVLYGDWLKKSPKILEEWRFEKVQNL